MDHVVIAHRREKDEKDQTLEEHLQGVADFAKSFAGKLGMETAGELIGLLHDLGKYSEQFQNYIKSALGDIDQDADEYTDAIANKGKIDHSTAGAQLIWEVLNKPGKPESPIAQMLALCIASHHSGLINCLEATEQQPAYDRFSKRMSKPEDSAHLQEVRAKMDQSILDRSVDLFADPQLLKSVGMKMKEIHQANKNQVIPELFKQGLLIRFLFSCLIDADRVDTADFENPVAATKRQHGRYQHFDILISRLEAKLESFSLDKAAAEQPVNKVRTNISDECLKRSGDNAGIFTLSVPTGGGKTLASLRFALSHAKQHDMERIIYVIPFTSIIDQNAEETRKILEPIGCGDEGKIVLEHHSNLTPEKQTWKNKILSENWDAPVVYTTMVQFLETLFGSGTRGARRMHQLAKSVIIFDEIQTLPVNCVHLFNNAVQFLTDHCGSSVVLCTATQPLLHRVDAGKGRLSLQPDSELMQGISVDALFERLRRVDVLDRQKKAGYSFGEIADLANQELEDLGSCLVIVNTKKAAQTIYQLCQERISADTEMFHLSTSMCPAHRKAVLKKIRRLREDEQPVLCISTQLIEAGVDVSFGAVVRLKAGLDSIAQAAGRCNRHGEMANDEGTPRKGRVSIVNLPEAEEKLGMLPDIAVGQAQTDRFLRDFETSPEDFNRGDLIGPAAMERYFQYYFFERKDEMSYPVADSGGDDDLLNLLSENKELLGNYKRAKGVSPEVYFRQSFMTAAKAFKAIDAPTRGIIVPYSQRGKEIINELCSAYEPDKQYALLREAQQYTVNVFPNLLDDLVEAGALHAVQKDVDILYLMDAEYYSVDFGLSNKVVGEADFVNVW